MRFSRRDLWGKSVNGRLMTSATERPGRRAAPPGPGSMWRASARGRRKVRRLPATCSGHGLCGTALALLNSSPAPGPCRSPPTERPPAPTRNGPRGWAPDGRVAQWQSAPRYTGEAASFDSCRAHTGSAVRAPDMSVSPVFTIADLELAQRHVREGLELIGEQHIRIDRARMRGKKHERPRAGLEDDGHRVAHRSRVPRRHRGSVADRKQCRALGSRVPEYCIS